MNKMDPEWKAKWLEALRSGRYEQGQGYLKNKKNKFCCLGVLCDLVDPTKWAYTYSAMSYEESRTWLPYSIKDMTRLVQMLVEDQLASMNDQGISFKEIANYIEENL